MCIRDSLHPRQHLGAEAHHAGRERLKCRICLLYTSTADAGKSIPRAANTATAKPVAASASLPIFFIFTLQTYSVHDARLGLEISMTSW